MIWDGVEDGKLVSWQSLGADSFEHDHLSRLWCSFLLLGSSSGTSGGPVPAHIPYASGTGNGCRTLPDLKRWVHIGAVQRGEVGEQGHGGRFGHRGNAAKALHTEEQRVLSGGVGQTLDAVRMAELGACSNTRRRSKTAGS